MNPNWLALNEDQKMKLQTDSQFVKDTFRYHVVPDLLTTQDMNDGEALDTLAQMPLRISIYQMVNYHSLYPP